MRWKLQDLTEQAADAASRGELCPSCHSTTDIVCVGSNPDGRSMNYAYDCTACGAKWEGY